MQSIINKNLSSIENLSDPKGPPSPLSTICLNLWSVTWLSEWVSDSVINRCKSLSCYPQLKTIFCNWNISGPSPAMSLTSVSAVWTESQTSAGESWGACWTSTEPGRWRSARWAESDRRRRRSPASPCSRRWGTVSGTPGRRWRTAGRSTAPSGHRTCGGNVPDLSGGSTALTRSQARPSWRIYLSRPSTARPRAAQVQVNSFYI